jgi:hypothetical protein
MVYSADPRWARFDLAWRALGWGGVSLGVLLCLSCGGKAYGDEEDEEGPAPSGTTGGVVTTLPVGTGSDTTRPDAVTGTPPVASGSGGTTAGGFEPLPGETSSAWVQRLLVDNCAECHGEANSVEALIVNGWLVPGDPGASPAIQVLMSRTPPHDELDWPSEPEILRLCEYAISFGGDCRALFRMLRPGPR